MGLTPSKSDDHSAEGVDLPADPRADALAVVRALRAKGYIAYFAGGCVRDALLGLTPKDYDVATDAPPERVRQIFPRTQAVGAAFGVILVRQGKSQVEVATFRADGVYLDGRHPDTVRYSSADDDAKRRDFTINGLFYDPLEDRVIDHVGGQADLNIRLLRAIGNPDARFGEDHLRMLRAVRFAARFNLTIEAETESAIRRHAGELRRISPERIADELRRMLTPATRSSAWNMLNDLGLLAEIFRLLPKEEPPAEHQSPIDASRSIFLNVAPNQPIPFSLALAATSLCIRWQRADRPITHYLSRLEVIRLVKLLRQTLKLSNDESDAIADAFDGIGFILATESPTLAMQKRFLARPASAIAIELLRAFVRLDIEHEQVSRLLDLLSRIDPANVAPDPLVTGDDLTAAGFSPGPTFKRVLDKVYDAQLEGILASKPDAMAAARAAFARETSAGR